MRGIECINITLKTRFSAKQRSKLCIYILTLKFFEIFELALKCPGHKCPHMNDISYAVRFLHNGAVKFVDFFGQMEYNTNEFKKKLLI